MKDTIASLLQEALNHWSREEQFILPKEFNIHIERPRDPNHGDFSSNVAMVLAKLVKMPPRVLAERLLAYLSSNKNSEIASIQIAGAGFINFTMSHSALQKALSRIDQSLLCGVIVVEKPETVVVDYSSPNLAKEMHVGHLRSTIIGDALVKVLALKGHQVIRQNHVGDWGTQFGMLLQALEEEETNSKALEIELSDLEAFYRKAKQRFDADEAFAERAREQVVQLQSGHPHARALWTKFISLSLSHAEDIYKLLEVSLETKDVKAESAYNDLLPEIVAALQKQQLLIEHAGAQCVFLEEFKGKDNLPLPIIVQKKDGGFLYATTDLAAIYYREKELQANRILYVVDKRQSLHFQQIFALAKRAGFASQAALEHVSFGMVLDKAGKPFKSREGTVVKLADLIIEAEQRAKALIQSKQSTNYPASVLDHMAKTIGIAAIKYADLSKNRTSDYQFDWDSMLSFEGNTAPYLLYAYTRIQSLFQKAGLSGEELNNPPILFKEKGDITLAKQITLFPEVIDSVVTNASPHLLCTYLYDLATSFSSFYESCPILNQGEGEEDLKLSRLKIAHLSAKVLELGLSLLGIRVLTRM